VGFVAHIKGAKSHAIVSQALEILQNLDHRGAVGADPLLGDGAGILIQMPDALFRKWADGEGLKDCRAGRLCRGHVLPAAGRGQPRFHRRHVRKVHRQGRSDRLIGWRDVPTTLDGLGKAVIASMPVIRQCFVGRGESCADQDAFERKLLAIRKQTQNPLAAWPKSTACRA
jgi:glutamate synthase (NADPH/NADH) large chain